MAFLTPIENVCNHQDCRWTATRLLWDGDGNLRGRYCLMHAHEQLTHLDRDEQTQATRRRLGEAEPGGEAWPT